MFVLIMSVLAFPLGMELGRDEKDWKAILALGLLILFFAICDFILIAVSKNLF